MLIEKQSIKLLHKMVLLYTKNASEITICKINKITIRPLFTNIRKEI